VRWWFFFVGRRNFAVAIVVVVVCRCSCVVVVLFVVAPESVYVFLCNFGEKTEGGGLGERIGRRVRRERSLLMAAGVVAKAPAIMPGGVAVTAAVSSSVEGASTVTAAVVSEVGIDELSCFRQLFLLQLQSLRAWAQSSFLKTRRFSRVSYGGGNGLLKGEQTLFYLIQRLLCLCKRDRPRRYKVCDCCDKESESCSQVSGGNSCVHSGDEVFAGHLFATDFVTCATLNRVWRSCFFGFLGGYSIDPLLVGLALVSISLCEVVFAL
jgi:hypothetical protein